MNDRQRAAVFLLAENNMRVSAAARAGFWHRNTFVLRIEQIRRETGLTATNFYDLCKLVEMAKKEEEEVV